MALKNNKTTTGSSTKEKMLARKKALENASKGGNFTYCKEGVTRVRILSPGPDEELGIELINFYLAGDGLGTMNSPQTFGEPCPIMEKYLELKSSKDDVSKEFAKKLIPKRRYALGCIIYSDEKGREVDNNGEPKVLIVPRQVYQDIINLYLDEDEAGDMTDYLHGYDIKITRTGSGKMDTTYTVQNCKPTVLPKEYRKTVDLENMIRAEMKSYDELEEALQKYLNIEEDTEEEEEHEDALEALKKTKIKKKKLKIRK